MRYPYVEVSVDFGRLKITRDSIWVEGGTDDVSDFVARAAVLLADIGAGPPTWSMRTYEFGFRLERIARFRREAENPPSGRTRFSVQSYERGLGAFSITTPDSGELTRLADLWRSGLRTGN